MEGSGWVVFGGGVVFFGGLFAYLMFMIFLPEWVGITGPTALRAEASHREGTDPDGSFPASSETVIQDAVVAAADPSGLVVGQEMVAFDVETQAAANALINPAPLKK